MNDTTYPTVREFADKFNVCLKTVYRQIKSGAIPAFKVGGEWRIDLAAFWRQAKAGGGGDRQHAQQDDEPQMPPDGGARSVGEAARVAKVPGRKPRWLATLSNR